MSKPSEKFIYFDINKKLFIMWISWPLVFVINMIIMQCFNIEVNTDIEIYINATITAAFALIISHFVSKATCYHEGSFIIKRGRAFIYMKNKIYEFPKEDVKKVVFAFTHGGKGLSGYYYFKIVCKNQKTFKITIPKGDIPQKIEDLSLFKVYKFLKE